MATSILRRSPGAPQDELENYCIGGTANISVEGDTMKFDWSAMSNGSITRTVGELKRQGARKR